MRRIEECGCPNRAFIGELVLGGGSFYVEINFQVVVQEFGIQVEAGRNPVQVAGLQHTILIQVSDGEAVRQVVDATGEGDRIVAHDRTLIDEILPVGIGRTQQCFLSSISFGIHHRTELIGGQYIHFISHHRIRILGREAHFQFAGFPFFSSDENNTIGCTVTINGGSRGIFQYGEGFNVIGVDHVQRVGRTGDAPLLIKRNSIDDDQRIVATRQGRSTANTDTTTGTGSSIGRSNLHTRYFTINQLLGRGQRTFCKILHTHRSHSTGQVLFTGTAITNQYHFTEVAGNGRQGNLYLIRSFDRYHLRSITNRRDSEGFVRCTDREFERTGRIGLSTYFRSSTCYRSTRQSISGARIQDLTGDCSVLGEHPLCSK